MTRRLVPTVTADEKVVQLQAEVEDLKAREQKAFRYIRSKVNQMLEVMGTLPLAPDELSDETLLDTDPIGTVAESFRLILGHLHQTNDKLLLANDEIKIIFDSAGAGILVVDRDHRIVTFNSKVSELFSVQRKEIIGSVCHETICRSSAPPAGCVLQQVLSSNAAECRADWTWNDCCFEVVGRPIHNNRGEISHVVVVYADISDRLRAEQTLRQALAETREARDQIDGILRSVADGLIVTDLDQRIILVNPRARELLAERAGALEGRPLSEVIGDDTLKDAINQATRSGEATKVDFSLPGFEQGIFEGRISVLRWAAGTPAGMVIIMHEVTLERTVERMKSEFVATAAHEFRTPLAAIMGFSELMLDGDCIPPTEQNEYLALIHEKAESLARIVNNLLDISRIESGEELPLTRETCTLQEILGATLPPFAKGGSNHTFEVLVPTDPVLLDVDRGCIEEVFENILSNAVKYSPDGGEVSISCAVEEDHCRISISDQGVGMTPDELPRVFEKFYRADSSNTAIRGTGLGMTIVRYIIEGHGCHIWLDSRKGEGTTVNFTLPLALETDPVVAAGLLPETST